MNILETLIQLRDDFKIWVTNNLNALNDKIDEKTIPIDEELSATSTNPVQNKVINAEINSLNNLVGDTPVETQISTAIANQNLFSGDYNDLVNAPKISEDNSDNVVIIDNNGNIILKVDAAGIHTTDAEIDGKSLKEKIPVWDDKSDFSGNYSDLENAPNILEDKNGNLNITDESGNIIAKIDANGIETTAISAENIIMNNRKLKNFSGDYHDLMNAPNIVETESTELRVADNNSNIIFSANSNGIATTNITADSIVSDGYKVLTTKDLVRVIYPGTIVPANYAGKDGDIYVQV